MNTTNRQAVIAALPAIWEEIREVNAKWHINLDGTPKPIDSERNERCMLLMMSEVMEAFESFRKGDQPDSHLPQYSGQSVELVDLFIRGNDFVIFTPGGLTVEHFQSALSENVIDGDYDNATSIETYSELVNMLAHGMSGETEDALVAAYSVIDAVIAIADRDNIPLMEIFRAKTDYNKTRADHKPEARAAVGGKKF